MAVQISWYGSHSFPLLNRSDPVSQPGSMVNSERDRVHESVNDTVLAAFSQDNREEPLF